MSRLFPRGVPSALSPTLPCSLLALLLAAPAIASPVLRQNPNPNPAPNGIDTSIMSQAAQGFYQQSEYTALDGGRKKAVRLYPASLYLGMRAYDGPRGSGGQSQQGFALADVSFSDALSGLDLDFQQYEGAENGTGGAVRYAFGTSREHYSQALEKAIASQGRTDSHSSPAKADADALVRTLVSYTRGLQTNVFVTGRSYAGQGTYTTEGGSVGQLFPVGRGGLTLSGVVQAIQFSPSGGSSRPYGSDAQYGLSLVFQDKINGYDNLTPKQSPINLWKYKVGGEYFSKAFGRRDALPAAGDIYVRYKTLTHINSIPSYIEVKPFYGLSGYGLPGQGHRAFYGVNLGITLPISL